jgi:hypothetical protein
MRDPERIPEIIALFQKAWELFPDQRFCQLIYNILRLEKDTDLYYVEDDHFRKALDKFLKEYSHYILDENKNAIPAGVEQWEEWYKKANNIVAETTIGDIYIITVFLGVDEQFPFKKEPRILFKTFVSFENCGVCTILDIEPYSTWAQAEDGHKRMVEKWSIERTCGI